MSVTLPETPGQWHQLVWTLAWPVVLANLTIPLVGAVDTAVMGRLPDPAYIGAVAVGATIFNAIYWMFGFLRMGTTGFVAQALGTGDVEELAAISLRGAAVAVVIGVATVLLQLPLNSFVLWVFDASPGVENLASEYLLIRVWGAPAMLLFFVELGVLFGLQRMRAALLISLLLNVTNTGLDLLFVIGFGWGISGVALGTIISEWFSALIGLYVVYKALTASGWRGNRPAALTNPKRLSGFFHMSVNLIMRSFFVQFPFLALTLLGAALGDLVLAANAVLMQLFFIMAYGLDGFAHTVETLAGNAFGARDPKRLRSATQYSLFWAVAIAAAMSLVYAAFGGSFIDLLTLSEKVRDTARTYLPWLVAAPLVAVWAFHLDGVFIGTTRTVELRNSMFLALLLYLAAIWLSLESLANHGIWLSMTVFMLARGVILALQYPQIERLAMTRPER